jgi:hypothetical protein
MPLPAKFSAGLRKLIFGTPWGETFPPRDQPTQPVSDGRTAALEILKRYISELIFFRAGPVGGQPEPFQIPPENIHIEWPDNEEDMVFPSIVFLSASPIEYAMIGFSGYIEEKTKDVYQPGTVLQWQYEHTETVAIEIWASKRAERRAILAGLESALTPTEAMYGLRFRVPNYFNQLVCFAAMTREMFEDPDAARNRRRARVNVEMRFNAVALVNYTLLDTVLKTEVDVDEDTGIAVGDLAPTRPEGILENFGGEKPRPPDLPPLTPCSPASPFIGDDE